MQIFFSHCFIQYRLFGSCNQSRFCGSASFCSTVWIMNTTWFVTWKMPSEDIPVSSKQNWCNWESIQSVRKEAWCCCGFEEIMYLRRLIDSSPYDVNTVFPVVLMTLIPTFPLFLESAWCLISSRKVSEKTVSRGRLSCRNPCICSGDACLYGLRLCYSFSAISIGKLLYVYIIYTAIACTVVYSLDAVCCDVWSVKCVYVQIFYL